MWRATCFISMLVACYAPTPPEGRPCGNGGVCPSALVCRGGVCVADGDGTDATTSDATALDASTLDAPASDAPADAATCPTSYAAVPGQLSFYRIVPTPQTWSVAEADCEDDGMGTHLAVVDTMAEDAAVDALTGASIWFGLTDRKVEGTPRWVTGATPTYTNFGGPGNTAAYDCSGIYQGKWAWGDCTTLIRYVCECDGMAAQPTAY